MSIYESLSKLIFEQFSKASVLLRLITMELYIYIYIYIYKTIVVPNPYDSKL